MERRETRSIQIREKLRIKAQKRDFNADCTPTTVSME